MQMHVAQRQSIPNLPAAPTQAASLPPVIAFDSLKSLPQRDYLQPHYESQQTPPGTIFTLSIMQKTLLGSAVCRGTRPHLAATVDIELRNVVDTTSKFPPAYQQSALQPASCRVVATCCVLHYAECLSFNFLALLDLWAQSSQKPQQKGSETSAQLLTLIVNAAILRAS